MPRTDRAQGETGPSALADAIAESAAGLRLRLDRRAAEAWVRAMVETLFPSSPGAAPGADAASASLAGLADGLRSLVASVAGPDGPDPTAVCDAFSASLPGLRAQMAADAEAIERGDPAAESVEEVVIAYPGFLAMAVHRMAHRLRELGVPVLPRVLSEWAHAQTGIDIHPGAAIGHPLVIDHGTGIVIGETAVIGDDVKLYQGVTIGALSVDKSLSSVKRHPTIEDGVVVYANATILGGETVIGAGSVIGGNTWITSSVPPGSVVYQRSEVHVRSGEDSFDAPDLVI